MFPHVAESGISIVTFPSTGLTPFTEVTVPTLVVYPTSLVSSEMLSFGCKAESAKAPCAEVATLIFPLPNKL